MLLVPGGRREDDVREQRRAGHAEVGAHQQVELALGRLLVPAHVLRVRFGFVVVAAHHVVVRAQQVLEEVLVALGGGTEEVRAPQHQGAWPVLRGIDVLDGGGQAAVVQRLGNVASRVLRGAGGHRGCGLLGDVQRVPVELRVERHPTHARGLRQRIGGVHAVQRALGERGLQGVGRIPVLPPLVGVHVPVAGADHGAWRALPVQGVGQGHPAGDRAALFLPDVVRPAAAVAPHGPGEQQQREDGPVGGISVEPLADAGAHDDHRAAAGILGVLREFAGDAGAGLGRDGGDLLLPGRGVGGCCVVVARRPVAGQPLAAHPVLREHQVEDCRDKALPDPRRRDAAVQHRSCPLGVVEHRQPDCGVCAAGNPREAQRRLDVPEV